MRYEVTPKDGWLEVVVYDGDKRVTTGHAMDKKPAERLGAMLVKVHEAKKAKR